MNFFTFTANLKFPENGKKKIKNSTKQQASVISYRPFFGQVISQASHLLLVMAMDSSRATNFYNIHQHQMEK